MDEDIFWGVLIAAVVAIIGILAIDSYYEAALRKECAVAMASQGYDATEIRLACWR